MHSRLFVITLLAVATAAALTAGQSQGGGAKPPAPKRAVIVTGENSYNGHVWKETSAELKNILDAGKDF